MDAALNIPALLKAHAIYPKKGLGQNFLVDPAALENVVEAGDVSPADTVLEVGAGLGSLTRALATAAKQVVAVELDERLFPILREVIAPYPNVILKQGDMLAIDPAELVGEPGYLVIANIPYYITSALIRHLLEARIKPRRLVLTVQREVAERICAKPGEMSLLALSVQVYGAPRIVKRIPAGAFYPAPKVDSNVVRVDLFPEGPAIPAGQLDLFFRLIKAGFSQKRKMLRNTLSAGLHITPGEASTLLDEAGIDPRRRAETVSMDEWRKLVEGYVQSAGSKK